MMNDNQEEKGMWSMNKKAIAIFVLALAIIGAGTFFTMKAVGAKTLNSLYSEAKEAYEAKDYEKSIPLYEQVLRKDAGHTAAITELAQSHAALEQTEQAIKTLQQGIYQNPEESSLYLFLSDLFLEIENVENSYETLEKGKSYARSEGINDAFQQLTDKIYLHMERSRVQKGFDQELSMVWENEEGDRVPLQADYVIEDESVGTLSKLEDSPAVLFTGEQLGETSVEVEWKAIEENMTMEVVDQLLSEVELTPGDLEPLVIGETLNLEVTGKDASGEDMSFDPEWYSKEGNVSVQFTDDQKVTLEAAESGKDILTLSFEDFTQEWEIIVEGDGESYVQTHVEGEGRIDVSPDKEEYEEGEDIQLEAIGEEGWEFVRWEGDLQGSENPVQHTMDGHLNVTAVFESGSHDLRLSISGEGEVYRDSLATSFAHNETISLRARPESGWTFEGWEGDVTSSQHDIELMMDEEKSLRAIFVKDEEDEEPTEEETEEESPSEAATYLLSVQKSGQGSVQKNKSGSRFDDGTLVNLSATPADGYTFAGWKGDVSGSSKHITLRMNSNYSVRAVFEKESSPDPEPEPEPTPEPDPEPEPEPDPETYSITVGKTGEGSLQVSNKTVQAGQTITVTAVPAEGWTFARWAGDASGTSPSMSVTMNRNKSVTAIFVKASEE
ncbi:InlB B-repeat-containing protein [Halobacillus sp. GSS1]|uniref:InlB B-repeat-containing protein n=1 Tax=Halobacillus sp. GSS1 TaxID=2815919 RepID=UPI001A8F06EA|nr:InlB B-repeat-containing protein [Halobacillus sp. GSS1]MBN9655065.1 InlB B-repeat-containing protein [Halobacillus sp. GSS1]